MQHIEPDPRREGSYRMSEATSNTYQWDIENPKGYANAMGRYKTDKELAFVLDHVIGEQKHILDVSSDWREANSAEDF